EHVVEVIAGVFGDLHATGEDGHLDGGGEVGRAEDDRLQAGRGGADLLDVDEAPGRLDLGLDADVPAGQAGVGLDLGEEEVESDDLRRRLHLGQHDLVEPLAGVPDDLDDVEHRPRRVPRVDADADDLVAPV